MGAFFNWENVYLKYGVKVIFITIAAVFMTMIVRKILDLYIANSSEKLKVDPTNFSFIKNSVNFIVYGLAFTLVVYEIPVLKSLGSAMFAGAGVMAAIIGFASQRAFSNIISGVFTLIFRPYSVGDTIQVGNNRRGVVEEITLRHTVIRDFESQRIIIPNNVISDAVIVNASIVENYILKHIEIGVSYDSDVEKAKLIMQKCSAAHPMSLDRRTTQEKRDKLDVIRVIVTELSAYSIDLRAYVWVANFDNSLTMKSDLLIEIKNEFEKNAINIPFPTKIVHQHLETQV